MLIHFICVRHVLKNLFLSITASSIILNSCLFVSVDDYFLCVENGRAATASLSAFFRKNFQQSSSKAG